MQGHNLIQKQEPTTRCCPHSPPDLPTQGPGRGWGLGTGSAVVSGVEQIKAGRWPHARATGAEGGKGCYSSEEGRDLGGTRTQCTGGTSCRAVVTSAQSESEDTLTQPRRAPGTAWLGLGTRVVQAPCCPGWTPWLRISQSSRGSGGSADRWGN